MITHDWRTKPTTEMATEINGKFDDYIKDLRDSGRMCLLEQAHRRFYSAERTGANITRHGSHGEWYSCQTGEYASLCRHLASQTTQTFPSFQATATNSDAKSLSQALLADQLLRHYMRAEGVEDLVRSGVLDATHQAACFISVTWNHQAGDVYAADPETGAKAYEGDLDVRLHSFIDVAHNIKGREFHKDWVIVRTVRNKYDIAAGIEGDDPINEALRQSVLQASVPRRNHTAWADHGLHMHEDDDACEVLHLFCAKSPALPNGREVVVCGDAVLFDGPLSYDSVPVIRLDAEAQFRSALPWTLTFDLLPLDEAHMNVLSIALSNQANLGGAKVFARRGENLSYEALADGFSVVEYDNEPPTVASFPTTPNETFVLMERMREAAERISGVSSVARGQAEGSIRSASQMAQLLAQTQVYTQSLQASFYRALEELGTLIISVVKTYAQTERVMTLSGRAKRDLVQSWTGADLEGITRVHVERLSPDAQTLPGRLAQAELLIQNGLITNVADYNLLRTTGSFEQLIEPDTEARLLLRRENEALTAGESVTAVLTDEHMEHIKAHRQVLDSPEARRDPDLVQRTLQHIQQHLSIINNPDPNVQMALAAMGQSTPQQAAMQAPAPNQSPAPQPAPQPPEPQG